VASVAALLTDDSIQVRKNGNEVTLSPVRNSTAEALGRMLNVKTTPSEGWTADDWRAYREQVAKAAKAVR
jgi:hypothetical protein